MQLILLSRGKGYIGHVNLAYRRVWVGLTCLALVLCTCLFYGGFRTAEHVGVASPSTQAQNWRTAITRQQTHLDSIRRTVQQSLDALAIRLGQTNAHVVRLDALGQRLTQMTSLDDGEFNFSGPPLTDNSEESIVTSDFVRVSSVITELDSLSSQLEDRQQQLEILEDFLINRKLHEETYPEGRPVMVGYISSGFGNRADPFTGRTAFHKGIDFAGSEGVEVVAVAAGVVTWARDRYGYGQMVEVNHGNGYVTRYAHNAENLVAQGDTVKRGQVIAMVGATGRATGPNLHFEVLHNGQVVDPLAYIY